MSKPISEELLSAFLDGELSPGEREKAEHLLRECSLHRECLDDLVEVSRALRSLPGCAAPSELRDTILTRVHESATSWKGHAPSRPTRLWGRLNTLLAASLLLTVGFWFLPPNGPDSSSTQQLAKVQEPGRSLPAHQSASLGTPATQALSRLASLSAPPSIVGLDRNQILLKLLQLGRLSSRGNSVQVQQSPDLVVEFTVVDVRQTLDQLQLLIKERAIQTSGETDEPTAASPSDNLRLHSVCFDLEGANRDIAELLSRVSALDAIIFIEDEFAVPAPPPDEPLLADLAPDSLMKTRSAPPSTAILARQPGSGSTAYESLPTEMLRNFRFDDMTQRCVARQLLQAQPSPYSDFAAVPALPGASAAESRRQSLSTTESHPVPLSAPAPGDALVQLRQVPAETVRPVKATVLLKQAPQRPAQRVMDR